MPPRLRHPRLQAPPARSTSIPPHRCRCICENQSRAFSSTSKYATRQRADMFRWLNGPGDVFRHPLPGSTNYLNAYDRSGNLLRARDSVSDKKKDGKALEQDEEDEDQGEDDATRDLDEAARTAKKGRKEKRPSTGQMTDGAPLPKETTEDLMPYPMNRQFRSQAVLSEELKDAIWKRVMEDGKSVRDVSAGLGVEMKRVAAVVRLKAVEKEWEKQGKTFATPYARAITSMLPTTPYIPNDPVSHESINDLPVHRATSLQLFHPVSESRHFTRRDAGKVFDRNLLPAEDRVPHTELVQLEMWKDQGVQGDERVMRMREQNAKEEQEKKDREKRRREREARDVAKVDVGRSVFMFHDVKVDERVGRDGRGKQGIGARYGVPHQDRKKGQVKIPTRVQ